MSVRTVRVLLAVGVAMIALLLSPAVPTFAAACFSNSCIGKDPVAQGCTARNVFVRAIARDSRVEERLEDNPGDCGAMWSRIHTLNGSQYNYLYTALWRGDTGGVYSGRYIINHSIVYSTMQINVRGYRGYGLYKVTSNSNAVAIYTPYYN